MIDPGRVRLFVPEGLKGFKQALFDRIGQKLGGVIRGNISELAALPDAYIPIIGCTPELKPLIAKWREKRRDFIYWDRGYARRVFATWLPRGDNGGYYRWHLNSFQMQRISVVPADRWLNLKTPLTPWRTEGAHVVVALPTPTYTRLHGVENWLAETMRALSFGTKRQIVIRDKESKRPLADDLNGAHALVAHGTVAAVEAVIMGCPVFVSPDSAAALVGCTDINTIEKPSMPDRSAWVHSLAYCQFNEQELVDGTLWRLIK